MATVEGSVAAPALAKGKGKGRGAAPPPPPKSAGPPKPSNSQPAPKAAGRMSLAEALAKGPALKSVPYTIITDKDGTKSIERKDGTRVKVPAGWVAGLDLDLETAVEPEARRSDDVSKFPAMAALMETYPETSKHVASFQEGASMQAVRARMLGELGVEAAKAFEEAAISLDCAPGADGTPAVLQGTHAEKHGNLGSREWAAPRLVTFCAQLARAGYNSRSAHEYEDEEGVLKAKVALLAKLCRRSKKAVIYAGAGLSTASGINDYATKSQDGAAIKATAQRSPFEARPNKGHRMCEALAREGLLWRLVQQNHDGLPQKAGVPQHLMNEIHGAWFDPSNPVVKMDGKLRPDLFSDLQLCIRSSDLVLVLGSSLCGMNADSLVSNCSVRAKSGCVQETPALGSVIVSLQRTPHDANSALRIFARIDRVAELLCAELGLELEGPHVDPQVPEAHRPLGADSDVFSLPYDENGAPTSEGVPRRNLDLRDGARLVIASGPDKGCEAVVLGKDVDGNWRLGLLPRAGCSSRDAAMATLKGGITAERLLGRWWIAELADQRLPYLPVVSAPDDAAKTDA